MKLMPALCALLMTAFQAPLLADKFDEYRFRFNLSGQLVTPNPTASAEGAGTIILYTRTTSQGRLVSAHWRLIVGVATSEVRPTWLPLRLIEGPIGRTVPVAVEIPASPLPALRFQQGTMPPNAVSLTGLSDLAPVPNMEFLQRLIASPSNFHFRVATAANPNGLAVGTIRAVRETYAGCSLKASNVVPPSGVDGAAEFSIMARDFGDYIEMTNLLDERFAGGEREEYQLFLHSGEPGANGPAVLDLALAGLSLRGRTNTPSQPSVGAPRIYFTPQELGAARTFMGKPDAFYVLLSTKSKPSGALRCQVRPAEVTRFDPEISAANVTPPVSGFAADGIVQIRFATVRDATGAIESAAVYRDGYYTLPERQVAVGVSIHEGRRGMSGPQVLLKGPFRIDRPVTYPANTLEFLAVAGRHAPLPGTPEYTALRSAIANPGAYYVSFHSEAFPNGFLRGQLSDAPANLPAISDRGIINAAGPTASAAAAPRGLTSVFGVNLAVGTLVAPLTAGALSEQFNGTEVTVGGVRAKLLFVSPGQLNIQIPAVAPGTHPLVVKTAVGTSLATNVNVTATAPGIFVITKADYSLITADSPVAAGDPIILWTTGLGEGSPRVAPGLLAPADPLSILSAVPEVLFGGTPGSVVAAAIAPGFAGVEQVAAIAAGGSGPVEVRLRSGGATSNPVTIFVR